MSELKLLEVYLGVHPNSDSKDNIEKRINELKTKHHEKDTNPFQTL